VDVSLVDVTTEVVGVVDGRTLADVDAAEDVDAEAMTLMSAQFLNCSPQLACTGASGHVPQ